MGSLTTASRIKISSVTLRKQQLLQNVGGNTGAPRSAPSCCVLLCSQCSAGSVLVQPLGPHCGCRSLIFSCDIRALRLPAVMIEVLEPSECCGGIPGSVGAQVLLHIPSIPSCGLLWLWGQTERPAAKHRRGRPGQHPDTAVLILLRSRRAAMQSGVRSSRAGPGSAPHPHADPATSPAPHPCGHPVCRQPRLWEGCAPSSPLPSAGSQELIMVSGSNFIFKMLLSKT